jgi:outer membrane protein OmpA-like peptidoglycan-associated protein
MREAWVTFKGEMAQLRHSLVVKNPLSTLAFLLAIAGLAWWCQLHDAPPEPAAQTGAVQGASPVPAAADTPNPQAMVPSTTEMGMSSSELLLKIARVMCCTSIDFEEGGAVLSARGRQTLDTLIPFFEEHLTAHLHLDGHTDNAGPAAPAKELSLARAQAARQYLVSKGVRPYQLTARGFGGEQPIQDNSTAEGRKRNRRIEFRI